jgi:MFS family permease
MIVFGELWGAPYVSAYYGVSIKHASLVIDMLWLGIAVSCPLTGLLSEYIKQRLVVLKLATLLGFMVSLLMVLNLHVPFYAMALLSFLLGCSASGAILTFAMINEINASSDTGTAIGFNNMMVVAGGALLHPLVGYILNFWWDGQAAHGAPVYTAIEYQHALWILPILYVVAGFIVSKKIKDSYTRPMPAPVSTGHV